MLNKISASKLQSSAFRLPLKIICMVLLNVLYMNGQVAKAQTISRKNQGLIKLLQVDDAPRSSNLY